jgi:N-acetylglucosamine kinase-like BadF-type ATPase
VITSLRRVGLVFDGGRTHLRGALVDVDTGEFLVRLEESGLPINTADLEIWIKKLIQLARRLRTHIDREHHSYLGNAAGLAGMGDDSICAKLATLLNAREASSPWLVESDALQTLRAASSSGQVLLVLVGTGSICLARDKHGTVHRCGGWGPFFEDACSGFEIARQAIKIVFTEADEKEKYSIFSKLFLEKIGCMDAMELRSRLYAEHFHPSHWAIYAPVVLDLIGELHSKYPNQARMIIEVQFSNLCHHLDCLIRKAHLPVETPLYFSGGITKGNPVFASILLEAFSKRWRNRPCLLLEKDPLLGGWLWLRERFPFVPPD